MSGVLVAKIEALAAEHSAWVVARERMARRIVDDDEIVTFGLPAGGSVRYEVCSDGTATALDEQEGRDA